MRWVCEAAAARGVVVGAQVSYRDRENFGRKHMDVEADVLTAWVGEQVELLEADRLVVRHRGRLPQAARRALQPGRRRRGAGGCGAPGERFAAVLGLPGSAILRLAEQAGRTGVHEGFPDRGYTDDGRLVPRDQPGALVEGKDAIAANAVADGAGRGGGVAVRAR